MSKYKYVNGKKYEIVPNHFPGINLLSTAGGSGSGDSFIKTERIESLAIDITSNDLGQSPIGVGVISYWDGDLTIGMEVSNHMLPIDDIVTFENVVVFETRETFEGGPPVGTKYTIVYILSPLTLLNGSIVTEVDGMGLYTYLIPIDETGEANLNLELEM